MSSTLESSIKSRARASQVLSEDDEILRANEIYFRTTLYRKRCRLLQFQIFQKFARGIPAIISGGANSAEFRFFSIDTQ